MVHWLKVYHVKRNLNDCDYLLYLDADAVFYNFLFKIEEELVPLLGDASCLVARDILQESSRGIGEGVCTDSNVGVLLFKNNKIVHNMLSLWDGLTDLPEHDYMRYTWPPEQIGFDFIMKNTAFGKHIKLEEDYSRLNAFYGHFIRHITAGHAGLRDTKYNILEKIYYSPLMERNRRLTERETICVQQ
jgi:hypothetical protein